MTEPESPASPQPTEESASPAYDVAIVGGGLSGMMTALRLSALDSGLRIGIFEEEAHLGGRSLSGEGDRYSYGQCIVTKTFYDFFASACTEDSVAPARPCEQLSLLSSSTLKPIVRAQLSDSAGIKVIGGNVAVKEWQQWQELDLAEAAGKAISKSLSLPRKGALATVMNIIAPLLGLTEFWEADGEGLAERLARFEEELVQVDWDLAWPALLKTLHDRGVEVHLDCPILSSERGPEGWQLTSKDHPTIAAGTLVVAVNPWDALNFVGKKLLPSAINQLVSRGKPVSLVTLTVTPANLPEDFPQWSLIPAEKTAAVLQPSGQLTFQVAIDFEKYLDAPSVVKAIKKLRRSHKKLLAVFEGLEVGKEHIALVPVGWSGSLGYKERKLFAKLADGAFQKDGLYFVGDAYGPSAVAEVNMRQSILHACNSIAPELKA